MAKISRRCLVREVKAKSASDKILASSINTEIFTGMGCNLYPKVRQLKIESRCQPFKADSIDGTSVATLLRNQEKELNGMKKYMLAVSVFLCTVMLGIAIAQEKPTEKQKPEKTQKVEEKAQKPEAKIQTGEVVKIDATKNEIVIKDDAGAEVRLLVSTSTKFTKADQTIALSDLKVGDKVASECEASTDVCKATSIAVIPPAHN